MAYEPRFGRFDPPRVTLPFLERLALCMEATGLSADHIMKQLTCRDVRLRAWPDSPRVLQVVELRRGLDDQGRVNTWFVRGKAR